ncbi:MAG: dockerin type I domain-containing protein [Planctomycetota bacterium]
MKTRINRRRRGGRRLTCEALERRELLASDVLTFVLDFKEASQPDTVDDLGNIVSDFDVVSFGFNAADFDTLADSILRRVHDDFFDELVGTPAGPVGSELALDFVIGDIGTVPAGLTEYYYIHIGTELSALNPTDTLGAAVFSGVRDASGVGPAATVEVGDVVGSVFTDKFNGFTFVTPPDAFTGGRFTQTTNAIASTISQQIGRTLSLVFVDDTDSVQPTPGVSPIMATFPPLPNMDLVTDREFSITAVDDGVAMSVQQQTQQLVDAVGLTATPAGTISGTVYSDVNQNGVQDSGEVGIGGVIVYADYDNDVQLDIGEPFATSNANGEYTVTGIVRDNVPLRQLNSQDLRPTGTEATSIVFTEFSEQSPDFIELQNVSGETIDTSGWFIAANAGFDQNAIINAANPFTFNMPSLLAPGEILTVTDSASDPNFWGSNLNFVTATGGWFLLVDNEGAVRESLFAGFGAEEIATFNVTINGQTFTADDLDWQGDGITYTTLTSQSYQRVGSADTNTADDFAVQLTSQNVLNEGLDPEFGLTSAARVVTGVSGNDVINVDLGNFIPGSADFTFFTALTSAGNRELYRTDGTSAGTSLVRDLSGSISSSPDGLVWNGNTLFFSATTNSGQRELYSSDGTFPGTGIVRDLSGATSSDPQDLTLMGSTVFFTAVRSDGQRELFRSDGTFPTTTLVRDLSGVVSSEPEDLTVIGSQLFFTALTSSGQRELFVTDGTFAGTQLVRDLAGSTSSDPDELVDFNGELYFTALQSNGQRELFKSDGTFGGTSLVVNLNGALSGDPEDLSPAGQGMYFTATVGTDRELYFTDGTSDGTFVVVDLAGSGNPSDLTVIDNTVYFVGRISGGERELYIANQNGTHSKLVRNLSGTISGTPQQLTPLGDKLVFTARRSDDNRELFISDGTFTGTSLVRDLSDTTSSVPRQLATLGGNVLFSAVRSTGEREVFQSNGTRIGTIFVANLSGTASSEPEDFTPAPLVEFLAHTAAASARSIGDGAALLQQGLDVNQDGEFSVRDVLFVVNEMARERIVAGEPIDVTGDGRLTARDALFMINRLSAKSNGGSQLEGELLYGDLPDRIDSESVDATLPLVTLTDDVELF